MVKIFAPPTFTMLILAFLLESSDGLSFCVGLSSSSKSNASLGLGGADSDLNEDRMGVIGFGWQ